MRTRKVSCNAKVMDKCVDKLVMKRQKVESVTSSRKKSKVLVEFVFPVGYSDLFDCLPDELVLSVLSKLCASANCPQDFFNAMITCKRLCGMGFNPFVLSKVGCNILAVKAKNWSESAHKFLKMCADTGNVEACYTLGMIEFYCLQNRRTGVSLIAKAVARKHSHALYSLGLIYFNGSGRTKSNKDLRVGVAYYARACFAGHVDAYRELAYCLWFGNGIMQNIPMGQRFLVQANVRELVHVLVATPTMVVPKSWIAWHPTQGYGRSPLVSEYGCNLPALDPHSANRFLSEWFTERVMLDPGLGLRLCSNLGCGRPETRKYEFHMCWICGVVSYCSRACQALDWKRRHKVNCKPAERLDVEARENENGNGGGNSNAGNRDMRINGISNEELLYKYDFIHHLWI